MVNKLWMELIIAAICFTQIALIINTSMKQFLVLSINALTVYVCITERRQNPHYGKFHNQSEK